MKDIKSIKVSLDTIVCLFIIYIMFLVVLGMYFYYNRDSIIQNYIENQPQTNLNDNYTMTQTITPKQTSNNNANINNTIENKADKKIVFGKYQIIPDKNILDKEYFEISDYGDEIIEFKDNNSFKAYLGWGNGILGAYTISNDEIICTAKTFYSNNAPDQDINISFTFKIINNSEIEITKAPSSYTIHTVDFTTHSLTNEIKEMSFLPFVVGTQFKIVK